MHRLVERFSRPVVVTAMIVVGVLLLWSAAGWKAVAGVGLLLWAHGVERHLPPH